MKKVIKPHYPAKFDRFIDVNVGAGGMLYHLKPAIAIINDINPDIANYYQAVKSKDEEFFNKLYELEKKFKLINMMDRHSMIGLYECKISVPEFIMLNRQIIERTGIDIKILTHSINFKIKRANVSSDIADIPIETAIKSAFYNTIKQEFIDSHNTALFYWLIQYGYGKDIRTNSKGIFNQSYGGYAVNDKTIVPDIERLKQDTVLDNATVFNMPPKKFLATLKLKKYDFVFANIPLRDDWYLHLPCQVMMVVKGKQFNNFRSEPNVKSGQS